MWIYEHIAVKGPVIGLNAAEVHADKLLWRQQMRLVRMLDLANRGLIQSKGVLVVLIMVPVLCRNGKDYRDPENQQEEKTVSFHGYAPQEWGASQSNQGLDCDQRSVGRELSACNKAESRATTALSQQCEKFLFPQSREFRFYEAWRNEKRGCGCQQESGTG